MNRYPYTTYVRVGFGRGTEAHKLNTQQQGIALMEAACDWAAKSPDVIGVQFALPQIGLHELIVRSRYRLDRSTEMSLATCIEKCFERHGAPGGRLNVASSRQVRGVLLAIWGDDHPFDSEESTTNQ